MGSRYAGSEREVRALCAFINLMRAADTLVDRTQRALDAAGLTASQFGVLEALLHCGPMCQCDLASKLLRSGASVTSVLETLERRGLVERERGREDRRFVLVRLTAKGRGLIGRVFPRHAARISEAFGVLKAGEQDELRRLCRKLGKGGGEEA